MTVAIMQPYAFPYIGYFQLVAAVDVFVFYDDVNFIKQGWINRNQILINNAPSLFTIPVANISSFASIKDTELHERNYQIWKTKFLKTLAQVYSKAPLYKDAYDLISSILEKKHKTISELCIESVTRISKHLGIQTAFKLSSTEFAESKGLDRADRLIEICKQIGSQRYINPIGGTSLYDKSVFKEKGIDLYFIESGKIEYAQFGSAMVPYLSIIDILMFNTVERIRAEFLPSYKLI